MKMISNHHCDLIYSVFDAVYERKVKIYLNNYCFLHNCVSLDFSILHETYIIMGNEIELHDLALL